MLLDYGDSVPYNFGEDLEDRMGDMRVVERARIELIIPNMFV